MKKCCEEYMMEQFGDADVAAEIYGEYVGSAEVKIGEAKTALKASDWTALDRIAHTIKGNALAVGDSAMADTAIELRKRAALSDSDGSAALVAKMEELTKEL